VEAHSPLGRKVIERLRAILVAVTVGPALATWVASANSQSLRSPPVTCMASQLRVQPGSRVSEKTEQHTMLIVLTNSSDRSCLLVGYPTITLFDRRERAMPFSYGYQGDQMITAAQPTRVRLDTERSAFFALNKNACVSFTSRVARSVRVVLPESQGSRTLRLSRYPILDYCRAPDPGHGITVSPIEPKASAVFCHAQKPCGPGVTRRSSVSALPPAGTIAGTLGVSTAGTLLFTAYRGSLLLVTNANPHRKSITVERVEANGSFKWRRIPYPLPYYLAYLSAGPDGLYAGTAVIKRFTNTPDLLERIDAKALAVVARASFPSRVAPLAAANGLWASVGDGRVLRLDPKTLHLLRATRLLSREAVQMQGASLSTLAFGLGSLWVLAASRNGIELVRMNPLSLAVRSRIVLPRRIRAVTSGLAADATHVYLTGYVTAQVGADGHLVGRPTLVPGLAAAVIYRNGLVGLLNGSSPALVLLTSKGKVVARTPVRDAGGDLAVSGTNAWFLGNAGQGNGIVRARLSAR